MSVLEGALPKVVWIDCHDPSNRQINDLLHEKVARIASFAADADASFFALRMI